MGRLDLDAHSTPDAQVKLRALRMSATEAFRFRLWLDRFILTRVRAGSIR